MDAILCRVSVLFGQVRLPSLCETAPLIIKAIAVSAQPIQISSGYHVIFE